jgi:hypothetical protein
MSEDRRRENFTDPGGTGLRYFKLYEAMTLNSGALAYPCRWTGTDWEAVLTATKVRIYRGAVSLVGYADDFVACIYMPQSRHWEVVARIEDWGWARLSTDLNALSSATARVWFDVSGTMTDSGFDITLYDRMLPAGEAIPTLSRVRWVYCPRAAKRYVADAACDADTSSTVWGE